MNGPNRCTACDVPLKSGESYMCLSCGDEHDAGYLANLLASRITLLRVLSARASELRRFREFCR